MKKGRMDELTVDIILADPSCLVYGRGKTSTLIGYNRCMYGMRAKLTDLEIERLFWKMDYYECVGVYRFICNYSADPICSRILKYGRYEEDVLSNAHMIYFEKKGTILDTELLLCFPGQVSRLLDYLGKITSLCPIVDDKRVECISYLKCAITEPE